uniref:Odorant binding protein n=1 Tax=Athetis dissimilis TaxID=1737331 RepID=A0A4D6Q9D2_ATHDI|nr:odorant binding protein [Athetis dissimilis]
MKRLMFCSLILMSVAENERLMMQTISNYIGGMVLKCQKKMEFKNDVIQDLLEFWNKDNDLRSEDLGCALVCVFEENDFLDSEFKEVQRDNVEGFFRASGAGDKMSQTLLQLFERCKTSTTNIDNLCDSALQVAKCFRRGIFEQQWAPARQDTTTGA